MASPQKENGYTSIANELMEAFARTPSIGSEAFQVLMLLLRRSYGFQKKDAEMSISFIAQGTGMKRRCASRAIERLVSKRLIVRAGSIVAINKNYDEWVVSKRTPPVQTDTPPLSKRRTEVVSKRTPNKERVKETPEKEIPLIATTSVADVEKAKKKKRDPTEPMTLEEFVAYMKKSSNRAINIIGEWADTVRPDLSTWGQWEVFMRRHLRPAQDIQHFTDQQLGVAYGKICDLQKKSNFSPTLETLKKFLTA